MVVGQIGQSVKDGGKPLLVNDSLVPGNDFKDQFGIWKMMTRQQAGVIETFAADNRIKLSGTIVEALKVERAFEMEKEWLKEVMEIMRNGKAPCIKCVVES